ncbi:hypothetical protein GDO81_018242 [Engystomops pustulosus]|uniref:Uncharacterized protein n=1 Tax=Engystomops pustulosus TaxID=76066 RepID=A0AAV7AAI9_ENGPU|nr:hypothetical protein GDO81_018242 [Engystomops pustulosus]
MCPVSPDPLCRSWRWTGNCTLLRSFICPPALSFSSQDTSYQALKLEILCNKASTYCSADFTSRFPRFSFHFFPFRFPIGTYL